MRIRPGTGARRSSTARRLATAVALASVGLATTASAALAAPRMTVDPTTDLDPAGHEVTVRGTGFLPPTVFDGLGVYVAQTAEVGGRVIADASGARWIRTFDGGAFEARIVVKRRMSVGGTDVDCLVDTCAVSTWRAHTNPGDASDLFTSEPISFGARPQLSVTPQTTGLDPLQPNVLTVNGSGFRPGMPGVYVAITAIVDGRVLAGPAKWLRPGAPTPDQTLTDDGAFTTTLTVNRTFRSGDATVDCAVTACAISTWRGHTLPTPAALISSTPLTFAAIPAPPPPPPPTPQPEPQPENPVLPRRPVAAAAVKAPKKLQRVGKARTARVGIIACRASTRCRVVTPRRVRVKIGRRTFRARVIAPRAVRPGKRAWVRVKLTKRAAKALSGRRAVVRVRIAVRADGARRVARTARVTLAKPKVGKLKRRAASAQA